jgi:uncharacterized membrane protein (DUF106 family)
MTEPHLPERSHKVSWEQSDFMKHSWKPLAATVYLVICLFDFVLVNIFLGFNREPFSVYQQHLIGLDPLVQVKLIEVYSARWIPQTLQYGGVFHVSFGAILTGVAIKGFDGKGAVVK